MDEELKPILMLVGFFVTANVLGLAAGIQLYGVEAVSQASAAYQSPASGTAFFAVLVAATALLLLLYRYSKQLLVKLWLGAAIVFTTLLFFDAFLPLAPALAATALLVLVRFRTGDMFVRSALDTVPFAGAGALFGALLGFQAVLVFIALLAVYDYVAVNYVGHMVTLAQEGVSSGTFMGFQYPKGGDAGGGEELVPADAGGDAEGERVSVGMLGGGDVVMPIVFAVSVVPLFGTGAAVSSIAGSTAALFLFLTVIQARETEKFYPAIPVVASGSMFGLVLFLLVSVL